MKSMIDLEMESHPRSPKGEKPSRAIQKGTVKAILELENLLERYIEKERVHPEQIVIITPHTKNNSLLSGVEKLGGYPLAEDPLNRSGAVLHTTIGRFKGLESDIVILADMDPEDIRCNLNARYVATSRARQVLHEFWKRPW